MNDIDSSCSLLNLHIMEGTLIITFWPDSVWQYCECFQSACIYIWGPTFILDQRRIENVQRRATQLVLSIIDNN